MTRKEKRLQSLIIILALLLLIISVTWFSLAPTATSAAAAPTATPAPVVTPPPGTTNQASIYWGDTLYLLCYESPEKQAMNQPAGILTFDVTGSDNVRITCRAPGTEGVGVDVRLKDGE